MKEDRVPGVEFTWTSRDTVLSPGEKLGGGPDRDYLDPISVRESTRHEEVPSPRTDVLTPGSLKSHFLGREGVPDGSPQTGHGGVRRTPRYRATDVLAEKGPTASTECKHGSRG